MASGGRYTKTERVGGHLGTWRNPLDSFDAGLLTGMATVEHVVVAGERLDSLAARYLGDETLYWVLALCNGIQDPFSVSPGDTLQVPLDVSRVLSRLGR